jgi:TetR/AcrR family tetracycline transcriptional repressor
MFALVYMQFTCTLQLMANRQMASSMAGPLTRERVIEVAAAVVAREGADALNMRRLAAECGVSSMTPYRHIGSKEELLRVLANRYLDEVQYPDPDALEWDEFLRQVFGSVRRVLLEHAEIVDIAARHHVNGLAGYRGAELTLRVLHKAGATTAASVSAFAALSAFTIGFVQQEIPRPDRIAQLADRLDVITQLPPDEFPNIRSSAEVFLYRDSKEHFDTGLEFVIQGIGATLR